MTICHLRLLFRGDLRLKYLFRSDIRLKMFVFVAICDFKLILKDFRARETISIDVHRFASISGAFQGQMGLGVGAACGGGWQRIPACGGGVLPL